MGNTAGSLDSLSILIVEDEVFIAQSLKANLLDAGARVVETAGGVSEAKAQIEATDYDLAILDIRLSDGEAFDLASSLTSRSVPVVVHSGHATSERNEHLTDVVFCAKPASPSEILQAIHTALGR